MRRLVIRDPLGLVIKLLINAILWYKCLVQRYVEIPNALLILGAFLVLTVLVDCRFRVWNIYRGNPGSMNLLFTYIALTFIVGLIAAESLSMHVKTGVLVIEFLAISLLILYYIKTRGDYEFILRNYLLLFGIMAILFVLNPVRITTDEGMRHSLNVNLNENSLALYLSMFIFSSIFYISKGKLKPGIGFVVCGIAFYAIFLTGSRKGFINAALFFVLWLFWVFIPNRGRARFIRFFAILAAVGVSVYILLPYFIESSLWFRLNNLNDAGSVLRWRMYEAGVELVKQHPVAGIGFDGFRNRYGTYSHSTIIEVFVSSGVPIGLIYFMSLIALLVENRRFSQKVKRAGEAPFSQIEAKMGLILLLSISISIFYIIHLFDLLFYYNMAVIMAPAMIYNKAEGGGDRDGKQAL